MATDKNSKVHWAIKKMAELAQQGDAKGIQRVYDWGYGYAKGSNDRKDTLRQGFETARAQMGQ